MSTTARSLGLRLLLCLVIAFGAGLVVNETAYLLTSGPDQEPREYVLEIPAGTAERLEAGQVVTSLPGNLTFVEGDVLVVKNHDTIVHQLGPIWVPPGAEGRMTMDRPMEYTVACSFQADNRLGLKVEPRVNTQDRLFGVLSFGLPSGVLGWLFSIILKPVKGMEG